MVAAEEAQACREGSEVVACVLDLRPNRISRQRTCLICSLAEEVSELLSIIGKEVDVYAISGGFGGGAFGGGPSEFPHSLQALATNIFPVYTTSFGRGGFQTFGGPGVRARARAQQAQPQTPPPSWVQLLPLLLLFAFAALSYLPSLFGFGPAPDPDFRYSPSPPYTSERMTSGLGIPYFVDKAEWERHPIYESIPESSRDKPKAGRQSSKLRQFENGVEQYYVRTLQTQVSPTLVVQYTVLTWTAVRTR